MSYVKQLVYGRLTNGSGMLCVRFGGGDHGLLLTRDECLELRAVLDEFLPQMPVKIEGQT